MTVPEQTALAIVGMSCRLPGADSIDAYWRLISEGRCAIAQLPANRFDRELYYHVEKGVRGKSYTSLGALATWPDCDFLPQDKKGGTDPAHVSFCQVAAEAFRDAGLDPNVTSERTTGVYVGHTSGTAWNGAIAHASLIEQTAGWLRDVEGYDEVAGSQSEQIIVEIVERVRSESPHRLNEVTPFLGAIQIALLVAKALKLNGPAMAINAACASSLMALSVAARALDQRQIDTAIVGGTSYLKPDGLILFSKAQSVSATGSRPFDEHADGLIVGEGCAALVIRRLDAAMADGNSIHAIIRGVGISSDGKGKSLWAPRKEGQMEAMRRAYGSNMDVQRLGYVEAHATSTQVGDATELSALSEVLQERPCRKIPVGSVKANIGHTLETAGVAGLLKAVLALKHRQIPPTINVRQPNSKIDWNASPLFLPTELQNWPAPSDPRTGRALPRQAAVNSFGIGGLNAHVVLDEFVSDQLLVDSLANPARIVPSKRPDSVPIAVIGAAAIFSQAANLDAFQSLLRDGRNVRSDVPSRRWNSELACRPNQLPLWKVVNTRGGFITDYEYDWRKHKVPPKQVANADPLQFMLLDAVDQALHDAGYEDKIISRERTGVVIGNIFGGDFSAQLQMGLRLPVFRQMLLRQLRSHCLDSDRINAVADAYESLLLERMPALLDETGSYSTSTLASRIAKTFNLMGGAFAIDAGNASSFAALSACMDSLRGYHCDLMICAAGQRSMDLVTYQNLSRSGVLVDSATGEINEEVLPAEGAGVLLLKRLEDAERDGDRIRAVVDSSQLSCHDELHAAIRMACCHVASTDLAKNGAEQMVRIETSFSGRSLEPSVKIDALRSIFGTEMEKQFSMNAIARQFGNVAAAAGIASMLKAIVDIDVRSPPKTIYCFAANVAPVGRLHQAACVKLKPWRPPTVCRNAHDASESFPVLDVFGSPYDMGYEHGRCLKDAIRKALKRHADLAGWSKGAPAELELWAGRTDAWFDATQLEEMNGIADGANVALASIVAHNLRLAADISGGGCVHAVLPETSMGLLHGANEDLPVSLSIKDCLQRQVQRRTLSSGEQYVTFGIAGQVCGINGMNTAGITVTSAMLLNRPVPKQPSKLHCVLVQRLLEKAVDIPDAVRMVEDFAPLSASAWGLWLTHAAAGESLLIEYDRHECRTRAATHETSTCAANHCQLLPATTTAKAHSLARFTRLKQLLSSVKASDDPLSGLQVTLRDQYDGPRGRITPHATMNTIRRSDNQISLVMQPETGSVCFTAGPLSTDENKYFKLQLARKKFPPSQQPQTVLETVCKRYVLRMESAPLPQSVHCKVQLDSPAWILGDNHFAAALAKKIDFDGGQAICLSGSDDLETLLQRMETLWHENAARHLFLMTALDETLPTVLEQIAWDRRRKLGVLRPYFVVQKWISLVQSANMLNTASVTACTSLGGDFGLTGNVVRIESGAITGLVKALSVEFGHRGQTGFRSKVIDVTATHLPRNIADLIARELAAGSPDVEVGYNDCHERRVPKAVAQPLAFRAGAAQRPRQVAPHGNWVITGGARGVTAVVARNFAKRFGAKLHLLGASPPPVIDPTWRNLSEQQLRDLKTEVCKAAARRGEKPIRAWTFIEKALEIDANLQQFRCDGVQATYHACDVSNRDQLAKTLCEIRHTYGSIDGVIHGAGFERSCRFEKKKREDVERTIAVKVDGAAALMELTAADRLQAFIAFGSVSGRWGALGQTDYCLANDMLAKLIDWFRTWRTDCPATVFHWPAWGEVGMAVRPETRSLLERYDVKFMPTAEGSQYLIDELLHGLSEREVLIASPDSPALLPQCPAEAPLEFKRPPLVDEIIQPLHKGRLKVGCHLDPTQDPFLIQHQFRGRPLLPIVIAIEAMLEASSMTATSGTRVQALHDIEAISGLHFHTDRIQKSTIQATLSETGVICELLCDFHNRAGRLMRPNVLRFRSRAEFSDGLRPPLSESQQPWTSLPTEWWEVEYPAEREEVLYHGPIFRNANSMHINGHIGWTKLTAPSMVELAGYRGCAGWLTSPGLLDSAMFSCGVYAWTNFDKVIAIPHRIQSLRLGRSAVPGETCYQRFEFLELRDNRALFDFDVFGQDGQTILRVEKYSAIVIRDGKGLS